MELQNLKRIQPHHLNSRTMNTKIKIAIVDDEQLFVEGLSLLLQNIDQLKLTIVSNDGQDFLNQLSRVQPSGFPDVVLLDIRMKPMDGFEVVKHLKRLYPDLHIIILSSHYKTAIFGHMVKLGVSAFLPKNASQNVLVEAITSVYKTGTYFSDQDHKMLATFVKSNSTKRLFSSTDKLSEREKEVLKLICSEQTNTEIAEKLYLSKRTVESHRQRILEKIRARNTAGLVIYAISHNIHTPDSKYYY